MSAVLRCRRPPQRLPRTVGVDLPLSHCPPSATAPLPPGWVLPYPPRNFNVEYTLMYLWLLVEPPRLFLGERRLELSLTAQRCHSGGKRQRVSVRPPTRALGFAAAGLSRH